jgi:hypothetical protein
MERNSAAMSFVGLVLTLVIPAVSYMRKYFQRRDTSAGQAGLWNRSKASSPFWRVRPDAMTRALPTSRRAERPPCPRMMRRYADLNS